MVIPRFLAPMSNTTLARCPFLNNWLLRKLGNGKPSTGNFPQIPLPPSTIFHFLSFQLRCRCITWLPVDGDARGSQRGCEKYNFIACCKSIIIFPFPDTNAPFLPFLDRFPSPSSLVKPFPAVYKRVMHDFHRLFIFSFFVITKTCYSSSLLRKARKLTTLCTDGIEIP